MTEILLSSEKLVKDIAQINDNIASDYILVSLREAQNVKLRRIMGGSLTKKLQTLIQSGEIEKEENVFYKELVDQCQYYLAYATVVELTHRTSFKITNFGVARTSDENLQPLPFDEVVKVREYYQTKVDFYAMELQKYIRKNRKHFPDLSADDWSTINHNLKSAASCGIFLGGPRGKK